MGAGVDAQKAVSSKTWPSEMRPVASGKGKWIGAKVGIFASRTGRANETGYADYDWFRIDK
jgi:hypothetical protein